MLGLEFSRSGTAARVKPQKCQGSFLPVVRARARAETLRISRRILSNLRLFSIHSRKVAA